MALALQESRLSNGLRLWLVEHHALPMAVLNLVLPAGATAEPAGRSGLAALTAEALETGTRSMTLYDIAGRLELAGATLRARALHDGAALTVSVLTKHISSVEEVFSEVLQYPVFPSNEIDRLREQRLAALLQQRDRPAALASRLFSQLLFGAQHPYGIEVTGSEPALKSLRRGDVANFHAEQYAPDAATLIAVGDLAIHELEHFGNGLLSTWKARGNTPRTAPGPPVTRPPGIYLLDRSGSAQSEIRVGQIALRRSDPELSAAMVVNRALGGQFSSRLNQNLRERRGLTYGAWSSFMSMRHPGPFVAGGAFQTAHTGEAVHELLDEIRRVHREGITNEEMSFSQKSMTGAFALSFETPGQIAETLQNIPLCDLPPDHYDTYVDRIKGVTEEDCRKAAERWFDPDAMLVVVVGDAAVVRPQLERHGAVIDCSIDTLS